MKKHFYILTVLSILFAGKAYSQNVGINPTGATPNASAGLDIDFSNLGMLIPRVALTQTNSAAPITTPATSLLVYNTASVNDVTPGYYYWNGAAWIRFIIGSGTGAGWLTNGNSISGSEFIGTTSAADWIVKTNNIEVLRVTSGGNVGIGTTSPFVHLNVAGNQNSGEMISIDNPNGGASASAVLNFKTTTQFAAQLFLNPNNGGASYGGANTFNLYNFLNAPITFGTNATERMRIDANGNVGIGTTSPADRLTSVSSNSSFNSINGSHTSASTANVYYAAGGSVSNAAYTSANGYLGYHNSNNKTFGVYGSGGDLAGMFNGIVGINTVSTGITTADLEIRNNAGGNPVNILLRQSASQTTNGTVLSNLDFGDNHTATAQARIQVIRGAAGGIGDLPTDMIFSTTPDASASLTERMRIDKNGNLGIGTISPSRRVDIDNGTSGTDGLSIRTISSAPATNPWSIILSNDVQQTNGFNSWMIESRYDGAFNLANGSSRMWIMPTGNVGIRTASPTAQLDVNGTTGYNQVRMRTSYTPANTADANGNTGDIAWDDNFIYVKTAAGWKRTALSVF